MLVFEILGTLSCIVYFVALVSWNRECKERYEKVMEEIHRERGY